MSVWRQLQKQDPGCKEMNKSFTFCTISMWMISNKTFVFTPGSPYYYSATSRGAGPAATATASAYDRHWPLLLRDEEDEEEEAKEGGRDGWMDSTNSAQYKPAHAPISDVSEVWIFLYANKHSATQTYCIGLTSLGWSQATDQNYEQVNLDTPMIYRSLVSLSCFEPIIDKSERSVDYVCSTDWSCNPYCDLLGKMLCFQVGDIFDVIVWAD